MELPIIPDSSTRSPMARTATRSHPHSRFTSTAKWARSIHVSRWLLHRCIAESDFLSNIHKTGPWPTHSARHSSSAGQTDRLSQSNLVRRMIARGLAQKSKLVRETGFEPAWCGAPNASKALASSHSATPAPSSPPLFAAGSSQTARVCADFLWPCRCGRLWITRPKKRTENPNDAGQSPTRR